MIPNLENFIIRKSDSNALIAIFGAICLVSQFMIGFILQQVGILDAWTIQTTLSSETFKAIALKWISDGKLGIYYTHFYLDYLHPVWYSVFLSLLSARLLKINDLTHRLRFFIFAPFAAAICDLFENTMHIYFLGDLSRATPMLVAISGTATNIKWLLSASCIGVIAVTIVLSIAGYKSRETG